MCNAQRQSSIDCQLYCGSDYRIRTTEIYNNIIYTQIQCFTIITMNMIVEILRYEIEGDFI